MKKKLDIFRKALVWGVCLAGFHLVWIILVLLQLAQPLLNCIFKLHMLSVPIQVQPFNLVYAIILLCVTFVIGTFYGLIFYSVKKKLIKSN